MLIYLYNRSTNLVSLRKPAHKLSYGKSIFLLQGPVVNASRYVVGQAALVFWRAAEMNSIMGRDSILYCRPLSTEQSTFVVAISNRLRREPL